MSKTARAEWLAFRKRFGQRVLQARLDRAAENGETLTQTAVAESLGVAQVTVGRWERGTKIPDLLQILRLAGKLEADPCWLAFGEEVHRPQLRPLPPGQPVPRKAAPAEKPKRRVSGR